MISVPVKASSTTMGRKTTCNGCGYSQWTVTSYYLDRKAWKSVHTLEFCRERKNDQAIEDMILGLFCGPR